MKPVAANTPARSNALARVAAAVGLLLAIALIALLARDADESTTHAQHGEKLPGGHPTTTLTPPAPRATGVDATTTTTGDAAASTSTTGATNALAIAAPAAPMTDADVRAALARGEPGMEVLASRLPQEQAAVAARWSVGDEWTVETWYRQMQAPTEPWTGPALWRFKVERETAIDGAAVLEVVVTRGDEPAWPATIVHVSADLRRVVSTESTVVSQGKERRVVTRPDDRGAGAALEAELVLAPFTLPPPGAAARVAPAGLPFDRRPFSRVKPAGEPLPAADELVGAGASYLDLEFPSPKDGTPVLQRWSPDDPRWPVVSRTETTLSFRRRS